MITTINPRRSAAGKHANRQGANLENAIMLSARETLVLHHLPKCGGRFYAPGKMINEKMPCDIIGAVKGTGRSFFCDAKRCADKYSINFRDDKILKSHQKRFLADMHTAGAIAGVLVECVARGRYLWCPGGFLIIGPWTWDRPHWIDLGPTSSVVEFWRLGR